MLADVGIADPDRRIDAYPHELSGGMLQRIAIAAALLARPALIVADEPTTAVDVTTEAQILHLLRDIRDRHGAAILVISHQLGVIAEICDRVARDVWRHDRRGRAGRRRCSSRPAHPYTQALLACEPALLDGEARRLPVIPGLPPNPAPSGLPLRRSLPPCRRSLPRRRAPVAACRRRPRVSVPAGGGMSDPLTVDRLDRARAGAPSGARRSSTT